MNSITDLLLPYQKQWIQCENKYAIFKKSRRIGVTFAEAARAVIVHLNNKTDYWFCSRSEKSGLEFINYVKQWSKVINQLSNFNYINLDAATSEKIILPNGNRITSLSSEPNSLRSLGGSACLDEMCFNLQSEELYTAAQPVIFHGGDLRIISTPNGPDTIFEKIFNDKNNGFAKFNINLQQAVDEGLALKVDGPHLLFMPNLKLVNEEFINNIKKTCISEWAFQQEYMCSSESKEGLIYECFQDETKDIYPVIKTLNKLPFPVIRSFIGLDFGYTDPTALVCVCECEDNNLYIVEEFYQTKLDIDKLGLVLINLQNKYSQVYDGKYKNIQGGNWDGVYCDQSRPEVRDLMSRYGIKIHNRKVKDVEAGIATVDLLFNCKRLKIFDCCKELIKNGKIYSWGKNNKPLHDGSDLHDAARYAISSWGIGKEIVPQPKNNIKINEVAVLQRLNLAQSEDELKIKQQNEELKKQKRWQIEMMEADIPE